MKKEASQLQIVDQRDLPISLKLLIESSNKTLQETQQKLLNDVSQAATELMVLLQLSPQDGWVLDIQSMRFIKVESLSTQLPPEELVNKIEKTDLE